MAGKTHRYQLNLRWTGQRGVGTTGYRDYGREHQIGAPGKADIAASSDPAFRGDPARWNPEELLVASLSSCHQLWVLHLCASAGIVVLDYQDEASGTMAEDENGGGRFIEVTLRPRMLLRAGCDLARATELHHEAHRLCFIANSVNFPVHCEPMLAHAPG